MMQRPMEMGTFIEGLRSIWRAFPNVPDPSPAMVKDWWVDISRARYTDGDLDAAVHELRRGRQRPNYGDLELALDRARSIRLERESLERKEELQEGFRNIMDAAPEYFRDMMRAFNSGDVAGETRKVAEKLERREYDTDQATRKAGG